MALELYTNPMSRGLIAHWMLEEVGEPYELTWISWGPTGNKSPQYLKVNPMGKVPTLVHDQHVVTEAAAICLYLAEAFPAAKLKPAADKLADYYRWTLFAAGPFEQAITAKSMGWQVPQDRSSAVGFGTYEDTVATLQKMLETREYVCGSQLTAADVYVGSAVGWGLRVKTLPALPVFQAYDERVTSRPAYQRVQQTAGAKIAELKKQG